MPPNRCVSAGGNSVSDPFSVENGVKQAGSLSPLLFAVYISYFLEQTRQSGMGCHIAGIPANALAYTDDIVLLSPTRSVLQKMVSAAEQFALSNEHEYQIQRYQISGHVFHRQKFQAEQMVGLHSCCSPVERSCSLLGN